MGVLSESSPSSNRESFAGRRRVSAVVAIAIVLLCGGLGFLLGSVFPPDSLVSRGHKADKGTAVTAAPVDVAVTQTLLTQSPPTVEQAIHSPQEAVQTKARLAPAQGTSAPDGVQAGFRPLTSADTMNAEQASKGITKKLGRKSSEQRKGSPRDRATRARRERSAAPATPAAAPAQSPGIISQIPIVGPVLGLFTP